MYKAELSLDQTNVQELLIAADMIQLKEASWRILNRLVFIGVSSSAANIYPDSTWISYCARIDNCQGHDPAQKSELAKIDKVYMRKQQCGASGSSMDPKSIGFEDLDPDFESRSRYRFRKQQISFKKRTNLRISCDVFVEVIQTLHKAWTSFMDTVS
jgi:hypothetical protein